MPDNDLDGHEHFSRPWPVTLRMCQTTCIECGIEFCVPEGFALARRVDGAKFFCPNGHQHWVKHHFSQKQVKERDERLKQ